MKIIHGTQGLKNQIILKQAEGGPRRIRCPKCNCLAVPTRQPDGVNVVKCGGCGANYQVRSM